MGSKDERLLREYITVVLREDGYGGFGGYGADYAGLGIDPMACMPGRVHYTDGDAMYKTFIKPFVDVVGVAAGKTKELSQRAVTTAKVAFESIMTTLIPVLTDDYAEVFRQEHEEIQKISGGLSR